MTLAIKSGGAWRTVADGKLRVKSSGAWQSPGYCRVKSGGAWRDSGYRGYPNPPSAPWVHSWGYGNLQAAWSPASGGPAISSYHVVLTNVNGSWIHEEYSGDTYSPNYGVDQDTRYQVYVRSVGTNGLVSAWQGPLRVGIGHPATNNYGWVQRTRGWVSGQVSGARNKDDPFWVGVGGNIWITGMHVRNLSTPQSSVVAPGTNRGVDFVVYSGSYGTLNGSYGTIYSGFNMDHPLGNWGDGSAWGIVARGAGWSTTGNGYYMLWCDALWMSGTEYYDNYEVVSTNPAQGNYYW